MNIIVSHDKTIRIARYNGSCEEIIGTRVFISKDLNIEPQSLILKHNKAIDADQEIYCNCEITIPLTQAEDKCSTDNYVDYIVKSAPAVEQDNYKISILFADGSTSSNSEQKYSIINTGTAIDEHAPIRIEDRTIIVNGTNNSLVAEDNDSQILTFSIAARYDGISFLDDTKTIQIDYIPVDFVATEEKAFLSDIITAKKLDPDDSSRLLLSYTVPYEFTQKAGSVVFALAVIGQTMSNNGRKYVWQTEPSLIQVRKNIGLRNLGSNSSGDDSTGGNGSNTDTSELVARIEALENRQYVSNIDINTAAGTISYTEHENGSETLDSGTYEIDDLYVASASQETETTVVMNGGSASGGASV